MIGIGIATGRLEILGAYADMAGGKTLTAPTKEKITVTLHPSSSWDFSRVEPSGVKYLEACIKSMEFDLCEPSRVEIQSNLPMGVGLGSSAALCVAFIRAMAALSGQELRKDQIAYCAYEAERLAGIPCGRMDSYAIVFGQEGKMLLHDHESGSLQLLDSPLGAKFSWLDTGTRHNHARGDGLQALDLSTTSAKKYFEILEQIMGQRESLQSAEFLGEAMNRVSEYSALCLENVLPEQIPILEAMQKQHYGAKITGGGFGGAIMILARQ